MGNDDENRSAIPARRARYIAMAVAGVSTATTACASACLRADANRDAGPPIDLRFPDATSLDAAPTDAGVDATDDADAR